MKVFIFKIKIICVSFLFVGLTTVDNICYAKKPKVDTLIYEYNDVEIPPTYPKGFEYINDYINKNIVKPDTVLTDSPFTTVYLEFVIEQDGTIGYVNAIEGYGDEFSAEVVRVFKTLSKWEPGIIKRKSKRVRAVIELVVDTGKGYDDEIFQVVESMPKFPGGDIELQRYLARTITYPINARNNGMQGRVYISFVVEVDGSITNIVLLRGVCEDINNEALRVVRKMPKWIPGTQKGKPVRVQFNLPIRFVLQGPFNNPNDVKKDEKRKKRRKKKTD